jgi:hypothetical protein
MWGANRYRSGYTGRSYNVTGGHEAEAKAAQRAKPPNRFGLFVLRLLGYKGKPGPGDAGPPTPMPPPQRRR